MEKLNKGLMPRSLVPSCGWREYRFLEISVKTVILTNHKFFCNFRFIAVQVQVTS